MDLNPVPGVDSVFMHIKKRENVLVKKIEKIYT